MYEELYAEQKRLEEDARNTKASKEYITLVDSISQGRFDETLQGNALLKTFFEPVRDKIQEYLDAEYQGHTGKTQKYIQYLNSDANVLAYVTLQSIVKIVAKFNNSAKILTVANSIMNVLMVNKSYDDAKECDPKLIAYLGSEYRRASTGRKQRLLEKHLHEYRDRIDSKSKEDVRAGAILIDIVLSSGCGMVEKRKIWENKKTVYVLSFSNEVFEILKQGYNIHPTMATYLPMVVKPKDWVGFKEGGYLTVNFEFVKTKSKIVKNRIKDRDYSKPMRIINKLQQTGWRVNSRVQKVIEHIYSHNMIDPRSPPTLPRCYGDLPTPDTAEISSLLEPMPYIEEPTHEQKKTWAIWNKKREKIQIGLDGEHGRRLQYMMTMATVKKMIGYEKFYYAYCLDYRSRVYPIADFFTPQSKGYVKAMLEFSEGKPLTIVGEYWLKIHIANTFGLDKAPFSERIAWVDSNKLKLLKVATDPLGFLSDWVYTDSPFEFLAGCYAYQDHTQGLPVHLPIQLDAVNSGVQMYSGLLLDKSGAKSTCVIGDVRSDLYGEVADRVEHKLVNKQYPAYFNFIDKEGVERVSHTKEEATSMIGNFTRSMTKTNVMTVPYSVSMRGMTLQNWDTMDDMKLKGKDFWKGDEWVVNKLWTELTYESIFEIVQGARAGQEYLKDVARLLKDVALWHTPIYNFPVMQPSFRNKESKVSTVLGQLTMVEHTDELKKQKQLSSIAANYIHSIDATILLYIVEHSSSSIGTIHDCFLVHPNEGEEVRNLYKEGYVAVMKSDPLGKFSKELDPETKVEIPYVGDLDLDDVYDSEYIIS